MYALVLVITYATCPLCHALDISDINLTIATVLMCTEMSVFVLCQMIEDLAIPLRFVIHII